MEVNRDEAERCREIAIRALRSGDKPRARKFLQKSLNLYPLPGVDALLSTLEKDDEDAPTSNGAYTTAPRPSASTAPQSSSSNGPTSGDAGRPYTSAQEELVREITTHSGARDAHYKVLGIAKDASESDIKRAYRKRALKLHPDKNSAPGADEAFKAVGLAYATLSDGNKRAVYDRTGEEDPDNRGGGMGRTHFNQQEVSPEEIFKMFFGGGVGPMGGMGGGVHMGPGFRVYSTGFGGPQFRSARQQPQQGQPQRQQEQFSWQSLIQFVPLLFLVILSFISSPDESTNSHTGGSQYFSLTHSPPYIHLRETKLSTVKDIPYYVTTSFLKRYERDRYVLAQVERLVENSYENYLIKECSSQKIFKGQLEKKARRMKDERDRLQSFVKLHFSMMREIYVFWTMS
uniref:J domain-containing protein n=2 Tax=Corethron hystrix TaxID=216773 RepID=A0A7S1BJR3_9STRA|mmetsp:Transcript_29331/g.67346  ORF Transcript_29331/g.67346 Transcript_29331/m.67346 type:complete len:402 (+) Transcript_29331:60-1265(+)